MQHAQLKLVKQELKNLDALVEISRKTFSDSFSYANTTENIEAYLNASFNPEKLRKELINSDSEFYFVQYKDETAGYLKINFGNAQTDLKEVNGMELERIYIIEKFQGKRLGQYLIDFVIETAKKRKLRYVWLGVWEKNTRAIAFYEKNGFEIQGTHPFQLGDEAQTDYIMSRDV